MSFGLCTGSVEVISVLRSEAYVTAHAVPLDNFVPGLYCYEIVSYYDGEVFGKPFVGEVFLNQELSCQQNHLMLFTCSANFPVPTKSPLILSNTSESMNCIISIGVAVTGTFFATTVLLVTAISITCFLFKQKQSCNSQLETQSCAGHQSQQATEFDLFDNAAYETVK